MVSNRVTRLPLYFYRNWRWVILSVFRLASWEDKGYVDLPSQSTSSRPLQCGFSQWWTALFDWIEEADQNPQTICRDDLRAAQMAFFDLLQLERIHTKASSNIKRLRRSVSQRRMPRETEKPPPTMIDEEPTDGTSTGKKDQDGHGMMKSENFRGFRTQTTKWKKCQDGHGVMNDYFSWQGFLDRVFEGVRTHVLVTTVCTTGVVHTLTCRTHIFPHLARAQSHPHFSCVSGTRMAQGWQKGSSHMRVISLHLTFTSLLSHPSLLFLDGHFETIPDFDVHTFLPYLPVLQAQGMRISARGRAVWPPGQVRPQHMFRAQQVRQDHFCGQWHDAHWRSRPQWNLWLLQQHTREQRTVRCSHNVWLLRFARFSWWFCSSDR